MKAKTPTTTTDPKAYKNFVDLMAVYAEATARLAAIQADLQDKFLDTVDEVRSDFAKLQSTIGETERAIEEIAVTHPEWFEKAKTVKTPYGSVGFRKTTKLSVANEEVTIVLIQQRGEEDVEKFIRTKEELNLEALEKLDDAELKTLRIKRETAESCTVKPAKLDLGKAVASAAKRDSAA